MTSTSSRTLIRAGVAVGLAAAAFACRAGSPGVVVVGSPRATHDSPPICIEADAQRACMAAKSPLGTVEYVHEGAGVITVAGSFVGKNGSVVALFRRDPLRLDRELTTAGYFPSPDGAALAHEPFLPRLTPPEQAWATLRVLFTETGATQLLYPTVEEPQSAHLFLRRSPVAWSNDSARVGVFVEPASPSGAGSGRVVYVEGRIEPSSGRLDVTTSELDVTPLLAPKAARDKVRIGFKSLELTATGDRAQLVAGAGVVARDLVRKDGRWIPEPREEEKR